MTHRAAEDVLEVEVPGYRTDIDHEVDLIEEIVRIEGYGRVGTTLPRAPHPGGVPAEVRLLGSGEGRPGSCGTARDPAGPVRLAGGSRPVRRQRRRSDREPASSRRGIPAHAVDAGAVARGGAQPGARRRAGRPLRGRHDVPARVAVRRAPEVRLRAQRGGGEGWFAERRPFDVLDATGILESAVFDDLGVSAWSLGEPLGRPFHPGRSSAISIGGRQAAWSARSTRGRPKRWRSMGASLCASSALGRSLRSEARDGSTTSLGSRPCDGISRSSCPSTCRRARLRRRFARPAGQWLTRCLLFDVFSGAPLPDGTRSLAYALELRERDRTHSRMKRRSRSSIAWSRPSPRTSGRPCARG